MTRTKNRSPIDRAYLHLIRNDLSPVGALEGLLADRVAMLAWRLKVASDRERYAKPERASALGRRTRQVDREFQRAFDRFRSVRTDRSHHLSKPSEGLKQAAHRLTRDPGSTDGTPLIQGTLISAGRIIGHIVEGWSWPEILAVYPELTESDIRECLAYTIEDSEDHLFD